MLLRLASFHEHQTFCGQEGVLSLLPQPSSLCDLNESRKQEKGKAGAWWPNERA